MPWKSRVVLVCLMQVMMSNAENMASASQRSLGFAAGIPPDKRQEIERAEAALPQLPSADSTSDLPRISLGETISFEAMGPVILNLDGTTRRIANWDQMTKREQEVAWRRVSKRNEERREIILEKLEQGEQESGNNEL
jgi:hypothetical protein